MHQNTITIGYLLESGEAKVLATHCNRNDSLSEDQFQELVQHTVDLYKSIVDQDVCAWQREDAPEYLEYTPEEFQPVTFLE